MSNSFYYLTNSQWKKIEKFFLQEKEEVARRLTLELFSTPFYGYSKAEHVGAIHLPVTVIGTAFITSSATGLESVFLRKSYER